MAITRESIAQHLTGLESRLQRGLHHLFAELLAKVERLEAEVEGLKQSAASTAEPLPPPLPASPSTANDEVVSTPPANNRVPGASPVAEAPSDSPASTEEDPAPANTVAEADPAASQEAIPDSPAVEPDTATPVDETSAG